jgi:hypothetical protein
MGQGVKTFTSTIIASVGIQVGLLFNTNGGGASDVGVKVGVSTADASLNGAAKLWSVRAGLNGGTEVERAFVDKGFGLVATDCVEIGGSSGTAFRDPAVVLTMNAVSKTWLFNAYDNGSARMALTRLGRFAVGNGPVATDSQGCSTRIMAALGANEPTLRVDQRSTHNEPIIEARANFETTPLIIWRLLPTGRLDVYGTDRTATIGADTQNRPVGINTLASGATSVVITNSLVGTASHVMVTFHADPGGRVWVTKAVGSFTVNVSAAPGANAPFSWEVKGLT